MTCKSLKSIRDSAFSAFGPLGSETRKANDIFEIVREFFRGPGCVDRRIIYLDCGTEDFWLPTTTGLLRCCAIRRWRTNFVNCRASITGCTGISRCGSLEDCGGKVTSRYACLRRGFVNPGTPEACGPVSP